MRHQHIIASASALLMSSAAFAAPPTWTISDEDSTITLFPTIHFLPEDLDWQSKKTERAFDKAGEIWFEVSIDQLENQAEMQALTAQLGLSPDRPLSARLDEETYAQFVEVAEGLGLPPAQLDPMRPWLAALTISVTDLVQAGFDPDSGVEKQFQKDVGDKPVRAFETPEQQFRFFAELPEATEIAFLKSALETAGQAPEELRAFAEDWAEGDVSGLEDYIIESIREVDEELYQVLIVRRNEAWVEALVEEMAGSGRDFVAVGAGHLVGEDGVPMLMKKRGFKVKGPLPK